MDGRRHPNSLVHRCVLGDQASVCSLHVQTRGTGQILGSVAHESREEISYTSNEGKAAD